MTTQQEYAMLSATVCKDARGEENIIYTTERGKEYAVDINQSADRESNVTSYHVQGEVLNDLSLSTLWKEPKPC